MNKTMISLFGFAALGLCVSAHGFGRRGTADPIEVFEQADTNHDGLITRDEYLAARSARFDQIDRNHDGFLSGDDFGRARERIEKLLEGADADGDGRVSREEYKNAGSKLFDMADTNHDGVVDKDELAQARERFKALHEQ